MSIRKFIIVNIVVTCIIIFCASTVMAQTDFGKNCLQMAYDFKKLEKFNSHRQKIAKFYSRELRGLPLELPQVEPSSRHVFLRYTIKTEKAEELIHFSKERGVHLGDWYRPVIAPEGVDLKKVFYQAGSCPKAEKASAMSVNLPTHPKMTMEDAKRIVKVIRRFYGS